MNLAKISINGQITIPIEIRRALKIKTGDKVVFFRKDNGEITMNNLSGSTIADVQQAVTAREVYNDLMNT